MKRMKKTLEKYEPHKKKEEPKPNFQEGGASCSTRMTKAHYQEGATTSLTLTTDANYQEGPNSELNVQQSYILCGTFNASGTWIRRPGVSGRCYAQFGYKCGRPFWRKR